jgi:rare lipoprotein A
MKRIACLAALLAGCSMAPPHEETAPQPAAPQPLPQPAAKGGYYKDDGPHEAPPPGVAQVPDAVPRAEPLHRYANRPYTVFGRDYVPLVKLEPFRQRGLASWYGKRFHGQKTASGETYDMYAMTAAHPTLPIPSYVRVTHVASGRSVVVRVNDRGPFHPARIIDLSYAAALKLGYVQAGSAQVEVESIILEEKAVWLQLGAFASRENAESLRARIAQDLAGVRERLEVLLAGNLWRLQVGPYGSRDDARPVAERIETQLKLKPLIVVR